VKILWVKSGGLLPLDHGGRIRSYQLVNTLASRHEVSLFAFCAEDQDPIRAHAPLENILRRVVCLPLRIPQPRSVRDYMQYARNVFSLRPYSMAKYCQPQVSQRLRQLLSQEEYDLLLCDFLLTAAVVPWDWPGPKVLFTHNVEAMIWERQYRTSRNPFMKAICYREFRTMQALERRYTKLADHLLAVSDNDRNFFARTVDPDKISVVPTGVDTEYFRPQTGIEEPATLVFTGSMDWLPNEDGILYFIENSLPIVRARFPQVRLLIIGRRPSPRLLQIAAKTPGITVTGTVEDIRPHMARGCVYIVPLLVGGGTRIKIFEAMASGKAVVSTTIGAEGLPVQHAENILLADDPQDFARCVVELLGNTRHRRELGLAARTLVEQSYSWDSVGKTLDTILRDAAATFSCKGGKSTTPAESESLQS
jgi:sugar transferase (PEP-CTERM/EpsH1 system associated)